MAVPKKRQSHARSAKRRSHHAIKPPQLCYCSQCGTAAPNHAVCPNCGHYQGRSVMETGS